MAIGATLSANGAAFQNGGFESPGSATGGTTFLNSSNSSLLSGWTTTGNNSEFYVCGNQWGINAGGGNCYLGWGANGTTGGTISQTFDTFAGHTYVVTYQLPPQQFSGTPPFQAALVAALDGSTMLGGATNSFNHAAGVWQPGRTVTFVAASASTTLRFTDGTLSGNSGPVNWALDNIAVTDVTPANVPEPSTWVLAAAGLGLVALRRRK